MNNTKSIQEVQTVLEDVMTEMKASDFRGLTEGHTEDYNNAFESVKAAHVSLGIAQAKLDAQVDERE